MTESPYIAPRLTLRVGVTGHRPNKLGDIDTALLKRCASSVLGYLAGQVRTLQPDNDAAGDKAPFAIGTPRFRLATAIAEGADRIVAEAALDEGYELNLILPFPRAQYAQDFTGNALEEFHQYLENDRVSSCTELDLGSTLPSREDAYLEAGQLMLAHSDVLIAIWDEQVAAGRGGTAEIVAEAQRRGLITVLVTLKGDIKLWSGGVPNTAGPSLGGGHWQCIAQELAAGSGPNLLADQVRDMLVLENSGAKEDIEALSPADNLQRFRSEKLHSHCWASGYELLRWAFLPGHRYSPRVDNGLARERSKRWDKTDAAATTLGGITYSESLNTHLRERWIGADNLAIHYSHKFRSAFVINFSLAALAVFVGLLAVFFWESKGMKAVFVSIELALIGIILWMTWRGRRGYWLERWLDYRSLAEALRPARLYFLTGSSPLLPSKLNGRSLGQDWMAWYVRASWREIAPPAGVIDAEKIKAAFDVTYDEEVNDQLGYHEKNAKRLRHLDHRLERTAEVALWATIASGALYLLTYGLYTLEWKGPADIYKPLATLLGGTLPVLGAAIFGIRATADFRSAAQQSERMADELLWLREILEANRNAPHLQSVHKLLDHVSQTLSDDLHLWGTIYSERELAPGF